MNRWLDRWLTLLLLALIGWAGWSCLHWLWHGADWTVVMTNLPLYAVGSYPEDERWRPLLCIVAVVVLIVITLVGPRQGGWRRAIPLLWSGMAPLGLWLLAGGLALRLWERRVGVDSASRCCSRLEAACWRCRSGFY